MQRIGIASSDNDGATRNVVEWIHYFKGQFKCINDLYFQDIKWSISSKASESDAMAEQFDAFWYRRPDLGSGTHLLTKTELSDGENRTAGDLYRLNSFTKKTEGAFKCYFWENNYTHFRNKSVGNPTRTVIDKMQQLELASRLKIDIPHTLITGDKKTLQVFYESCDKSLISKSITDGFVISIDGIAHNTFSEQINEEELNALPAHFFPNLYQEKLDKAYEIRAFFLQDTFYSMAIFSQKDQKTTVDFRKYNAEKPNRVCRYQLPADLTEKLKQLMQKLQLNTGSLDIVRTKDERFVFLEVNPVGQFGMVSYPCNFGLEREIAVQLLEMSTK